MRKPLFAFVAFLALAQVGLGLAGAAWGLVRGECSSEASGAIAPSGEVIESRAAQECAGSPVMVGMGATVAAGGALALTGLAAGARHRLGGMAAVLAGAVLGLPLGYTVILAVVPLFLAGWGVLAVYLAAEERRRLLLEPSR